MPETKNIDTQPVPSRPPSVLAGFLSYLVPGLGQIVQGRVSKGLFFMVCLLSLFFAGQAMGGWMNVFIPNNPGTESWPPFLNNLYQRWHFGGQFWIGIAAWPAIWQYNNWSIPFSQNSPFLRNYQKAPPENEINDVLRNRDRIPDVGWVYTVIAGMLNILVIYDAYAGPAYLSGQASTVQDNKKDEG